MYKIVYSNELAHHGIRGQKWGKKQGPPYPLDDSDHSAAEKKAGWKKSLGKVAKVAGATAAIGAAGVSGVVGVGAIRKEQMDKAKNKPPKKYPENLQDEVKDLNLKKQYDKLTNRDKNQYEKNSEKLNVIKTANDSTLQTINMAKNANQKAMQKEARSKMDLSNMSDKELRDRINRRNLERQYKDLFAEEENVSRGRVNVDKVLSGAAGLISVTSSALAIAISVQTLRGKLSK